jgi:uncharacterized protein YcaQ
VTSVRLSLRDARRLAVKGQLLSAPRPRTIEEVVRGLGMVQMDPISAVARTEHLVLFSRLGSRFRVADLDRLRFDEHKLFEYWAFLVPMEDFAVHREAMRRYPDAPTGERARRAYVRRWLDENAAFRRYILRELRRRGPLRSRDLDDRSVLAWRSGGWSDDERHVGMMLEILWSKGEVMVVGRDGPQRVWDLAERLLPVKEPRLPPREVTRRIVDTQLRAHGIATAKKLGFAFDGRSPGWERALADLVREGGAVPAEIDGLQGEWFAHAEVLDRLFRPRTVLLSPFDRLIHDRDRAEALFGFHYRLEIYVPKAKRRYGYYVLPILQGERPIGRLDPFFDRKTGVLRINGVWAEDDAPPGAGPQVRRAIDELARWLGASDVAFSPEVPRSWRASLV